MLKKLSQHFQKKQLQTGLCYNTSDLNTQSHVNSHPVYMTVTIPYVRGNSETITGILQPNSIVCYTQTNDHFTTTAYKLMSKTKTAQRAD